MPPGRALVYDGNPVSQLICNFRFGATSVWVGSDYCLEHSVRSSSYCHYGLRRFESDILVPSHGRHLPVSCTIELAATFAPNPFLRKLKSMKRVVIVGRGASGKSTLAVDSAKASIL